MAITATTQPVDRNKGKVEGEILS